MTLRSRFIVLLAACLGTFLLAVLLLRRTEDAELARAVETYRQERVGTLQLWVELSGQNLRQLANDYSLWDEMVTFVAQPDPEWARINLAPTLFNFDVQALWVLDPTGQLVHHERAAGMDMMPPPLETAELLQLKRRDPFSWFFHRRGNAVWEVRVAPIQPSDDTKRQHPPQGWLVVARIWNASMLETLGRLTESRVELLAPGSEPPPNTFAGEVTLWRSLPDWRGRPLALLHLTRRSPEILQRLEADDHEARIFFGFGILLIALLGLTLNRWVINPISALETSLSSGQLGPLQGLRAQPNELGRLAALVESSFTQRAALEREIEERRRVEEALRTSETSLRHAIDERVRLGRDLHDSVIQSVYAAGLGLATIKNLLRHDPAEAERRLEQIRHRLNETIRDLRTFITGLEPETMRRLSVKDAAEALVEFLRTTASIDVRVAIADDLAERLPLPARANLLQIMREALSNVLRHAQARHVEVAFAQQGERAVLVIADDGCGFDPIAAAGLGQGLLNIRERAKAADATLHVETAPGKGTRLEVSFPLTGGNE